MIFAERKKKPNRPFEIHDGILAVYVENVMSRRRASCSCSLLEADSISIKGEPRFACPQHLQTSSTIVWRDTFGQLAVRNINVVIKVPKSDV